MEKLEQIYDETRALILELKRRDRSEWLARFKDTFEESSSAMEVLWGVHFHLHQMLEYGGFDVPLLRRMLTLLGKVEEVLIPAECVRETA